MDAAAAKIEVSRKHLTKVQAAWEEPTDWADLCIYGLYALETAVQAAGLHVGLTAQPTHPAQVRLAKTLHEDHGLPDIEELLVDLQRSRLHEAYGEIKPSGKFDAESIASFVEEYVVAVEGLLA
jgi:hypothetical protein